jgi:very-short-patch-repair endonuclease
MDARVLDETDLTHVSIIRSDLPAETKLERARTELLDLSANNRLLNIPRSARAARIIEVADEKADEIHRLLVKEGRTFTFLAGRISKPAEDGSEEEEEVADLPQPADEPIQERGVAARHSDTRLQTRLTSEGLQKRLLDMHYDARTLEEEQGVNILYLALGTLKWIDPNNAKNVRFAPLVLVPVSLDRGTAAERFRLRWRQEDLSTNLSLELLLDRVHGMRLPSPDLGEDADIPGYAADVASAVRGKAGWEVLPDDIVLGFFSFAKFLMYRDLDQATWPKEARLVDKPLVRGLLADGFDVHDPILPEHGPLDPHVPPADMLHIVDCDSSQMAAIHEVRRGRNLVIQGPPGTGKSQTIANVIASAVADGKTVLFVAEKMAALEVVKRRLDGAGVGDACLELHSNKANKRAVLEELRRTWELGEPRGETLGALLTRIVEARDDLNAHAHRLHRRDSVTGRTPFETIGQLTRLRQEGHVPSDIRLPEATSWSPDDFHRRVSILQEISHRIDDIGLPSAHPWRHVGLETILPTDVERLKPRLAELAEDLGHREAEVRELATVLEAENANSLSALARADATAKKLAEAPDLEPAAFEAEAWATDVERTERLIGVGKLQARVAAELAGRVREEAWYTDLQAARDTLGGLPDDTTPEVLLAVAELDRLLPQLAQEAVALRERLGTADDPRELPAVERLAALGDRVAAAPDARPEAFAATVWDRGVEQAADLVEALSRLAAARAEIGDKLSDTAWSTDLVSARQVLAAKGSSLTRFLSGEWRQANRLVTSVLRNPSSPLSETLGLLDALARGRSAAAHVEREDAFARSAFGPDWRGDRSDPKPLAALVDWMRTLRGLGAEPRMIASRVPVRSDVASRAERLSDLVARVRAAVRRCPGLFGPAEAEGDLAALARKVAAVRAADDLSCSVLVAVPDALASRLELLRMIQVGQGARKAVEDGMELGRGAFGSAWKGGSSDWEELARATAWMRSNGTLRHLASRIPDRAGLSVRTGVALESGKAFQERLSALLADLAIPSPDPFGTGDLYGVPFADVSGQLSTWSSGIEGLSKWVAYRERANRARELGLGPLLNKLEDGRTSTKDAVPTFEMSYFEMLYAAQVRAEPAIGRFDGELHSRRVAEFASLDRQRIAAASLQVARAHHDRIPKGSGGIGPLGVLRAEMARRRGHMPIRQLVQRAGSAFQALKPVLMMSPLSVAQFLAPGALEFDLLVMDEASQIQPVDALGAVARCRQVVVVGDEKQLPPTRFFAKVTGSTSEDDEEDAAQVADIESILGLFTARGLPQRMLRWHYRSHHQSLIAVSNSQFYENKLFIVPSPYTAEAGMGLRFHHLPHGVFDSGNSNANKVEAKAVAEAIVRHAKAEPGISLGVVAFSVTQRRAILDELEALRRVNADTEPFFHAHPSEPFFVKNLENVQGDERDVIIISVGYGRNPQGYMAMRFGPLGSEGGERRLNVLISRAKRRCEVYASITDEDIDLERGKGKGIFAFKLFLHFARTGRLSMAQATGRDHDSVFEQQVARALTDRGYLVQPQVGIAGFFVDLGIADPEKPGRYVLGIECDGAPYHEARSARERDRLRQAVLEDHGWIIHRIWSTDWFQRPNEQLERAVAAIEAAKSELDSRAFARERHARATPVEIVTVDRADVTEVGLVQTGEEESSTPYEEHVPELPRHATALELHETPTGTLAAMVAQVVAIEGPVHLDEVTARVRSAWGLQRSGARIQAAVERAAAAAEQQGAVLREGSFLSVPSSPVRVRDRSIVASASLRKPEMLPPAEIQSSISQILEDNLGATEEELVSAVLRAFGFKAASTSLRDVVTRQINALVLRESISRSGDLIVMSAQAEERIGTQEVAPVLEDRQI